MWNYILIKKLGIFKNTLNRKGKGKAVLVHTLKSYLGSTGNPAKCAVVYVHQPKGVHLKFVTVSIPWIVAYVVRMRRF